MRLTSRAFENGARIPIRYTGEGEDVSPPLEWSDIPGGCKSFAIICQDPDAARKGSSDSPVIHWIIYNISGSVSGLPEGLEVTAKLQVPVAADQGVNTRGKPGYMGPKPPQGSGAHRYQFVLYALDSVLGLEPKLDHDAVISAIQPHILSTALLTGKFEKTSRKKAA